MAIDMLSYAIGAKSGGGGGGGGGIVVNAVYDEQTDTTTLDKTWNEIKNVVASGGAVYIYFYAEETDYSYRTVTTIEVAPGYYSVFIGNDYVFSASSADSDPDDHGGS